MTDKAIHRILAAIIASTAITCNTEAIASTCYDIAVQRFNKARVTLDAPYNYAQAVYAGSPPIDCKIDSLYLGEYSLRITCADGFKYEIGTTGY
jgi:hypothetical protein